MSLLKESEESMQKLVRSTKNNIESQEHKEALSVCSRLKFYRHFFFALSFLAKQDINDAMRYFLRSEKFQSKFRRFSYLLISQARQHSQRSVAYYWSYPQIGHCSGTRGQHIRFWANGQSKTAATNFSQIHGNKDQRGHLWLSIKTVTKIDWSHAGVPLDNLSFGLGKKHFCCPNSSLFRNTLC